MKRCTIRLSRVHLDPQNVPVNREAYANYANERTGTVVQAVKGISIRVWFERTSESNFMSIKAAKSISVSAFFIARRITYVRCNTIRTQCKSRGCMLKIDGMVIVMNNKHYDNNYDNIILH